MKRIAIILVLSFMSMNIVAQNKLKSTLDYLTEHFTFNGYAHLGWEYGSESDPNNSFKISRIIVFTDYRINDHWDAFAMVDFKAFSLHEMWINYKVAPWMQWKIGQFKTPFTLENPISPVVMEMITQMSLAGNFMVAGSSTLMMPGGAGRDIGLTVYGDLDEWASYDLAVMNGEGRNRLDGNSWKDFVGRLTFHPIKGLDVSGSVILGKGSLSNLSLYNGGNGDVKGNYTRNRYSAGFQLKTKPVNLRCEWMWGKDADLKTNGGYATAQVNNIGVKNLDMVASYDRLDLGEEEINRYQAGFQYWFYKMCRIQAAYTYTDITGVGHEHGVLTQLQVGF